MPSPGAPAARHLGAFIAHHVEQPAAGLELVESGLQLLLLLPRQSDARLRRAQHADSLTTVEVGEAVLRDFDTVESLGTLPEHIRPVIEKV